ncbi:AzlD domain-containing protein [Pleurocapsa sp. FMAR1]|uniref:AzlD domain-containing protein n=1 Tax=Pleurocapsa sp. FMAR1 TaxID=3040204 RepID=UPI0029C6374A|nr:AzlD domain-containing protein [Pleurocapsa sp. FMAR1]
MSKQEFYLIGAMAVVTFLIRYPFLAFSNRIKLPAQLIDALEFLPPAILTAIIVPAVLMPTGDKILLSYTNAKLVGAIAAILISWRTKNLLATIIGGMLTFLIWQWLLSVA